MVGQSEITHNPLYVSFTKTEPYSPYEGSHLAVQSLETVPGHEECFYNMLSMAGLERALILLMAGNLPFYQARLEALFEHMESNYQIDFSGLEIGEDRNQLKQLSNRLMTLVKCDMRSEGNNEPLTWTSSHNTTYYWLSNKNVSVANPFGTVHWAANDSSVIPELTRDSIGNHLAAAMTTAEFAIWVNQKFPEWAYIFRDVYSPRLPLAENMNMLKRIFTACVENDKYYHIGDTIRSVDPYSYKSLPDLKYRTRGSESKPLIGYRSYEFPLIQLKERSFYQFSEIYDHAETIIQGDAHLVFIQNLREEMWELQMEINTAFNNGEKECVIPVEKMHEILGDNYQHIYSILKRNNIFSQRNFRLDEPFTFNKRVFFLEAINSQFLPDKPAETALNIRDIFELMDAKGVIDGGDLLRLFREKITTSERPDSVYDFFRKNYCETVLPQGTLFMLNQEQRIVLKSLLEKWDQLLDKYLYLVGPKGAEELKNFYRSNNYIGEYTPMEARSVLIKDLLNVLIPRLTNSARHAKQEN